MIEMLRNARIRNLEGWRFRYGVDGYDFIPYGREESIVMIVGSKFKNDEAALEWVKHQAQSGSIYHQRAIQYLIVARMDPKSMIKNHNKV